MSPDPDLTGFTFARRPAHPLYAKILGVVFALGFIGGIVVAIVEPGLEPSFWKFVSIGASALSFLGLVAVGTLSAHCTRCRQAIPWLGFTLDRDHAIAIKTRAQADGVDIILPHARDGKPCDTISFNCFRCDECRIVYVTGVSDPMASSSS